MRRDIHLAALRSAAKVAFSVAFVGGCGGNTNSVIGTSDAPVSSESAYGSQETSTPPPEKGVRLGKQCEDAGADAKPSPSCDVLLAEAFGDGNTGPIPGDPVSQDLKACCSDVIKESVESTDPTFRAEYHWDCCAVTNWGADLDFDVGFACTPWGPPVPPPMIRRVEGVA